MAISTTKSLIIGNLHLSENDVLRTIELSDYFTKLITEYSPEDIIINGELLKNEKYGKSSPNHVNIMALKNVNNLLRNLLKLKPVTIILNSVIHPFDAHKTWDGLTFIDQEPSNQSSSNNNNVTIIKDDGSKLEFDLPIPDHSYQLNDFEVPSVLMPCSSDSIDQIETQSFVDALKEKCKNETRILNLLSELV